MLITLKIQATKRHKSSFLTFLWICKKVLLELESLILLQKSGTFSTNFVYICIACINVVVFSYSGTCHCILNPNMVLVCYISHKIILCGKIYFPAVLYVYFSKENGGNSNLNIYALSWLKGTILTLKKKQKNKKQFFAYVTKQDQSSD